MLGFSQDNGVVGLDIGSHSVKAVELSSHRKRDRDAYDVSKIGYALPPRDAIVEGTIIDSTAVVETIKVNLSVPSPVGGTIVELNRALEESPEFVNQDPYDKGWLAIFEVEDAAAALNVLKTAAGYFELASAQAEAEILR